MSRGKTHSEVLEERQPLPVVRVAQTQLAVRVEATGVHVGVSPRHHQRVEVSAPDRLPFCSFVVAVILLIRLLPRLLIRFTVVLLLVSGFSLLLLAVAGWCRATVVWYDVVAGCRYLVLPNVLL